MAPRTSLGLVDTLACELNLPVDILLVSPAAVVFPTVESTFVELEPIEGSVGNESVGGANAMDVVDDSVVDEVVSE